MARTASRDTVILGARRKARLEAITRRASAPQALVRWARIVLLAHRLAECAGRARFRQAWVLTLLGVLHRLAGHYRAAAASHQQALETLCEIGEPFAQGFARNELGLVQQLIADYQAAAASHQQALRLMRDGDEPYGQADVLNSLGELASRTSATSEARDHHSQALSIARRIGAPLQEARALEGIGHSHLQDGY